MTQKIVQSGVKTPATLTSMTETGTTDPLSGGIEYSIEVEVKPEGGAPYKATFNQQLIEHSVHAVQGEGRSGDHRQRRSRRPELHAALGLRFRLGAPLGAEDAGRGR